MMKIIDMSCFSCKIDDKKENEDSLLPPTFDNEFNLVFAIADGVGSTDGAEMASRLAIEAVKKASNNDGFSVKAAFTEAKKLIDSIEIDNATTLTVVHVSDSQVIIGHSGDCRAYYKKNNKLIQITKDHTKYQEYVDSGEHNLKNLKNHRERLSSVLSVALSSRFNLKFDTISLPIAEVADADEVQLTIMSDGAYKHWDLRPKFSEKTMSYPSAFASSLRKRIERNVVDDYTYIGVKIKLKGNDGG